MGWAGSQGGSPGRAGLQDQVSSQGSIPHPEKGQDSAVPDPEAHLMDVVSRCVPTEVKPNLCFVRLVDHQLRITVDSAGSATRVRFAGSAIRAAMQKQEGLRVDRVTLHVKPREEMNFLQHASTSQPEPVSESNVALIESTARSISKGGVRSGEKSTGEHTPGEREDPLAQALYRLAGVLNAARKGRDRD